MERKYKLMWIQEFKIALIEEDTQKLAELADADLQFCSVTEIEEAMFLIKQANELCVKLKSDTALSLKQLKKNIDFIRATEAPPSYKLDIIS